jgi:hypothetical protein
MWNSRVDAVTQTFLRDVRYALTLEHRRVLLAGPLFEWRVLNFHAARPNSASTHAFSTVDPLFIDIKRIERATPSRGSIREAWLRSGPGYLNSFPRFISGFRVG